MGIPNSGAHLEDTASATVTYDGTAKHKNASTATAVWRIFKITYDANGNLLSITWADGNELYDNIWDNRATTVNYV